MLLQQDGIMGHVFSGLVNGQLIDGKSGSSVIGSGFGFGGIFSSSDIRFRAFQ